MITVQKNSKKTGIQLTQDKSQPLDIPTTDIPKFVDMVLRSYLELKEGDYGQN